MTICPERGNNMGSGPLVRGNMTHAWNLRRLVMPGHLDREGVDAGEA